MKTIRMRRQSARNGLASMPRWFGCGVVAWCCCGCRLEMHDQPKHKPLEASKFFEDEMSARPLVAGTVARGHLRTNTIFFEGLVGTNLVQDIPLDLTRKVLERGQERFNIYCSVCHGLTGEGNGMIVQRGFPQPPSFHIDRLRDSPVGYFYRVMTYGYGVMFPYASRVTPEDRWAIASYIRALQLSQSMTLNDLPDHIKERATRDGFDPLLIGARAVPPHPGPLPWGEGESSPVFGGSNTTFRVVRPGPMTRLPSLPLPKGEGRGEGEGSVRSRPAAPAGVLKYTGLESKVRFARESR